MGEKKPPKPSPCNSGKAELGNPEHDGQPAAKITGSSGEGSDDCAPRAQQAGEPPRPGEQHAELANAKLCGCLYRQSEIKPTETGVDALCQSISGGADMADTDTAGLQRVNGSQAGRESSETQRQFGQCGGDKSGQAQPCLGSMAYELPADMVPGWWEVEPDVGRVTNETKDRANKLKGLGNAQVPLQAAVAFSFLMELVK